MSLKISIIYSVINYSLVLDFGCVFGRSLAQLRNQQKHGSRRVELQRTQAGVVYQRLQQSGQDMQGPYCALVKARHVVVEYRDMLYR